MGAVFDQRLARRCDWLLLLLVACLLAVALPVLYSAGVSVAGGDAPWALVQRQALGVALGLVALLLINLLDHHHFGDLARPVYWLAVLLLVAVLFVGREVNGSKSWFVLGSLRLQPSELAKLGVILALGRFLATPEADGARPATLLRSLGIVGLPMALILLQPDLGTTITFGVIWLSMLWWSGTRWWQLGLIVALALAAFALLWQLDVLEPYQKNRITVLFNPDIDPRGQGYNLRQSLIAVGSGGLWGQGWLEGTQTHLRFLPERHTDFIFAVLAEEWGFIGTTTVLALYAALIWRAWGIVSVADSEFGRVVAVGCTSVLLVHVLMNVGMVVGLLPITGLPLPFFSYGGSNMITSLALIGLLLNIGMRRRGGINY